jgi:hypothetical protein
MTKVMDMSSAQMELGFRVQPSTPACGVKARRPRSFQVSRWWFARMRAAVSAARDWQEGGAWGPTEQAALPLATNPGSSRFRPTRRLASRTT